MATQFEVTPLSVSFLYAGLAPAILADLSRRYEVECNIAVRHWAAWVFTNDCAVPVPTQIDSCTFPAIRARQLLKQSLQEVERVEMHRLSEADKFTISTAIDQLDELNTLGIA